MSSCVQLYASTINISYFVGFSQINLLSCIFMKLLSCWKKAEDGYKKTRKAMILPWKTSVITRWKICAKQQTEPRSEKSALIRQASEFSYNTKGDTELRDEIGEPVKSSTMSSAHARSSNSFQKYMLGSNEA